MNNKQNRIALIPARLESTRLANKLLLPLGGKAVIVRTYEAVVASGLFNRVLVVCNHQLIAETLDKHQCDFILDKTDHPSGTDRIAAIAEKLEEDIIVNIQGDEPFIERRDLEALISLFDQENVQIASLKTALVNEEDINNPNNVKVVTNAAGRALYFSRAPIPYHRDAQQTTHFKHIGIYGFKRKALLGISKLPPSPLEKIEQLENLRMLENGYDIYLTEVKSAMPSIDTEADYQLAVNLWNVDKK